MHQNYTTTYRCTRTIQHTDAPELYKTYRCTRTIQQHTDAPELYNIQMHQNYTKHTDAPELYKTYRCTRTSGRSTVQAVSPPTSHRGGSGSIAGQHMKDLWQTDCCRDRFIFGHFSFVLSGSYCRCFVLLLPGTGKGKAVS